MTQAASRSDDMPLGVADIRTNNPISRTRASAAGLRLGLFEAEFTINIITIRLTVRTGCNK